MPKEKEETKEKTKPLNIYQKLVDVRRDVKYLQKTAKGYNYEYVEEASILGVIRPKLDEHNLILEVDMISLEPFDFQKTVKNSVVNAKGLRAEFRLIWINGDNPQETIEKTMMVQEEGFDSKTIGAMMTYATRYFLLKYFNVPVAKIDPDSFGERMRAEVAANTVTYITKGQLAELETLINGYPDLRAKALELSDGDLSKLELRRYAPCIKWVTESIKEKKEAKNV